MKHNKIITPEDSSLVPDTLPDRTNLSELYGTSKDKLGVTVSEHADTDQYGDKSSSVVPITLSAQMLLGLLVTIPAGATYLTVMFIYQGAATGDPLFPLLRFFVSAAWLITCLVSARAIRTYFYAYDLSFSTFIPIYLFYFLPVLSMSYDLFAADILGLIATIAVWFTANCLIVPYMLWSLRRAAPSLVNKFALITLPIVVLIISAVVF